MLFGRRLPAIRESAGQAQRHDGVWPQRLRVVIALPLLAGLAAGCSSGRAAEDVIPPPASSPWKIALYTNTSYDDPDLHGTIVLADEQGNLTSTPTDGMYAGSATWRGDDLFFSDPTSENRWDVSSDEKSTLDRGRENLLEQWAGLVGQNKVTVFNGGFDDDGRYRYDIVFWDGTNPMRSTEVYGDLWATTSCNDRLYVLVTGEDVQPEAGPRSRLLEVIPRGDVLRRREVADANPPRRGMSPMTLGCMNGQVVALFEDRRGTSVGTVNSDSGQWSWASTTFARSDVPRDYAAVGNHFVFVDAATGSLTGIQPVTGAVDELGVLPPADRYLYSSSSNGSFAVTRQVDDDVVVSLYDRPGGLLVFETTLDGLGDQLVDMGEILVSPAAIRP
jgi:hypothetical protein